jgi:hypothetical protein
LSRGKWRNFIPKKYFSQVWSLTETKATSLSVAEYITDKLVVLLNGAQQRASEFTIYGFKL